MAGLILVISHTTSLLAIKGSKTVILCSNAYSEYVSLRVRSREMRQKRRVEGVESKQKGIKCKGNVGAAVWACAARHVLGDNSR